jgi:hypothetical protein
MADVFMFVRGQIETMEADAAEARERSSRTPVGV